MSPNPTSPRGPTSGRVSHSSTREILSDISDTTYRDDYNLSQGNTNLQESLLLIALGIEPQSTSSTSSVTNSTTNRGIGGAGLLLRSDSHVIFNPMAAQRPILLPSQSMSSSTVDRKTGMITTKEDPIRTLVHHLFTIKHLSQHQHPKTIPPMCPVQRGKRHRHPDFRRLNNFRHWWKTSRLLVRLSGCYEWCIEPLNWGAMGATKVRKSKGLRHAVKYTKRIGRGGPNRDFLKDVHPATRTLRLIMAIGRALEARADDRFYQVGLAEACAFMGNRCFRYWARHIADGTSKWVVFPMVAWIFPRNMEHYDSVVRVVIILMGLIRAVLPFASSFQGSRFGRQITFATFDAAHYRWRPMQSIHDLREKAGVYKDTDDDPELVSLARKVSVAIGHGEDPTRTRAMLGTLGFRVYGTGSGGYAVFRTRSSTNTDRVIFLHVTPYGPSISDEMPRYIVIERRPIFYPLDTAAGDTDDGSCVTEAVLNLKAPSQASLASAVMLNAASEPEATLQGFTYSGAFFTSQQWAALKLRYDKELLAYDQACKIMGTRRSHTDATALSQNEMAFPPTDLLSLKTFIRTGRPPKKRRRDDRRWRQIQREVKRMADMLRHLIAKSERTGRCEAPKGVILYMEGLDCSGKSSTGGLIRDALNQSGYTVETVQYNRPPTEEEKRRPWMDRFALPITTTDDSKENGTDDHYFGKKKKDNRALLIWDRGPAGDFVYGNLNSLNQLEKIDRYEEFRTFDMNCREKGVLFCKVLFLADRDSIATTLGKRLAHKKIVRDLHTWLDANSVSHDREGLDEIENHIDPTDFVAYNNYDENLHNFVEFARNTDDVGHVGTQRTRSVGYDNPWLVVSTAKRHPARLALMRGFEKQLDAFATNPANRAAALDDLADFFGVSREEDAVWTKGGIIGEKERGVSILAVLLSACLICLTCLYFHQSWGVDIHDIV